MPSKDATSRTPELWGVEDPEIATEQEPNEAILMFLDGADPLPETVQLHGYVRVRPQAEALRAAVLERLLEYLDENYGNPDVEPTDPTPNMLEAERVFLLKVLDEYEASTIEEVSTQEIYVPDWIEAYAPQWLEEPETRAQVEAMRAKEGSA